MKQIPLTQGKTAVVDDQDYELLMAYSKRWQAVRSFGIWYAIGHRRRSGAGGGQRMHRVIMDAAPGQHVDHKNGDGLDNRRENLRFASREQNGWNRGVLSSNTSGLKGVNKFRDWWQARITVRRKRIFLGRFRTVEEAGKAYDAATLRYHGEFARPNTQ